MANKEQYTAEQFIKAIRGSGGIILAIAQTVGCDYNTVRRYIDKYSTVRAAFQAEKEKNLDLAESVVLGNIGLAVRQVKNGMIADSGDAKWLLSRLGKHRGFAEASKLDVTSGGEPIKPFTIDDFMKIQAELKQWQENDADQNTADAD